MSHVEVSAGGKRRVARSVARTNGRAAAIRERNEAKLLKAAQAVFAKKGFSGATTAEIARRAGIPKPNLHYYFRTKRLLYAAVLDGILDIWVDALGEIRAEAEPADALRRYIARKMESSRSLPLPSRLWIAAGKMDAVDPAHLLFGLWAMTQTYADFAAQISAVLGKDRLDKPVFAAATATLTAVVLKGTGAEKAR
jgi:TetR/AcrR family transcriptional regulator